MVYVEVPADCSCDEFIAMGGLDTKLVGGRGQLRDRIADMSKHNPRAAVLSPRTQKHQSVDPDANEKRHAGHVA